MPSSSEIDSKFVGTWELLVGGMKQGTMTITKGGRYVYSGLSASSFGGWQTNESAKIRPGPKSAQLTLEGRVVGLLRTAHSHHTSCLLGCRKCGTAETTPAVVAVTGGQEVVTLTLPGRTAAGCEDQSVYNHEGPLRATVLAGKYVLHETWGFGTTHPAFHCQGASAEFSPQPYYLPESYWFSEFRPFNGLATRDFGFRVTLKVIPEFRTPDDKAGQGEKR
jgi:hypothetical protein